jgi:hypothetical protein
MLHNVVVLKKANQNKRLIALIENKFLEILNKNSRIKINYP